ncbi:hypothetical protein L1049_019861 [Liquidambar formosana]|uniref:Protein FAR1-RELATED SEQUENCE n=1 Tax=Liquidambar formosana TaxID=63359 RepID=A0AAP0XAE5_LIQFO
MDRNDDDLGSPCEEDMVVRLQTSNKLDLNVEQDCRSPKVAHVSATQSSLSLKDEANGDGVLKIGMEFESDEHAYKFYNKYAGLVGFSVRKDWVNRSKVHGQVVSRKFTCSKEGYRRKDKRDVNVRKHRKETRTGCLAHMIITRQPDEMKLNVTEVTEDESASNSETQSRSAFELMGRRFGRQHFENPSFFYAIQLDTDDKVSNIFWADDDMIVDYDHFGDVVCLDTIYRTDKDFRPFVQFIGLNHHKQVVIFGAALLYDETVESLKWLFQTFVEAMSGKKPKAILTDQDAAISRSSCFSLTRNKSSYMRMADDEEDFIHAWEAMLEKHGLRQNEWLRWMYREREKWAVAYGRNTFFVDMKSTHLGESLSSNFRNHLNSDLDVLQFFKHFERVLDEQRCKEMEASFDMSRCMPRLMGNVVLLKHASDVYTPKAFEVFQREYEKCLNVVVNQCGENGSLFEYRANTFGQPQEYTVTFNCSDDTVACSCMKFEYVGVLCSHALKVLDHRNIKVVPSRYILKRWTKDARIDNVRDSSERAVQENPKLLAASRYKDLCHSILKISSRAAESEEAFQYASRQLDEVMQGVEKILTLKPAEAQAITSSSTGANVSEGEHAEIFLDSNAIESQDNNNREKGMAEQESALSDNAQLKILNEKSPKTKRVSPTHDAVASILCPLPVYDSSQTPTPIPVTQNLYNFEANQVVQCMYQPPNLVMDTQSNPNVYQPPSFYSNQHDSTGQSQLIQESLIRSTYQESVSNSTQSRQAMDLDVQHPHSSSFVLYDQRFRPPDAQYFGSK